jgi:hypothetical protein
MGSQMSATRKLAEFTHDLSYLDISVTGLFVKCYGKRRIEQKLDG